MKNRKKWIWIPVGLVGVLVLLGTVLNGKASDTTFRAVTVERGTVEEVVSSSGTLQATETVEVGTQVSGQVAEILVDFNDRVTHGQLLARIDPTLLLSEVRAAEASLARNQAELAQAERTLARTRQLHSEQVVTDSEIEQAQYARDVAAAARSAAAVSLERAQRNLGYSEIRAPIDGIVVERSVDVGQTVAAAMTAPKLFVIARDLSEMEILASVDESDIGRIRVGQAVRFTVQAHGDRAYTGEVRQVRLQATNRDNVVSYGVVVGVENPDGTLIPGMTATVDFQVARAENVLRVANTALRFQPPAELRAQPSPGAVVPAAGAPAAAAAGNRAAGAAAPAAGQRRPAAGGGAVAAGRGMLWRADAGGKLVGVPVEIGLTDGQFTEVRGESLEEGAQVVAGVTGSGQASTSNPFQMQAQQGGPPGPPRGF
jgi:HlyD family secretion protein